jgi:hypothetical protein
MRGWRTSTAAARSSLCSKEILKGRIPPGEGMRLRKKRLMRGEREGERERSLQYPHLRDNTIVGLSEDAVEERAVAVWSRREGDPLARRTGESGGNDETHTGKPVRSCCWASSPYRG